MGNSDQTLIESNFRMKGVGKQIAQHLTRLDVYSLTDLLFHLPYRYQDRTKVQNLRQVLPGEDVVIEGVIQAVSKPLKGKTKLLCELRDETGRVSLRFFHVMSFQTALFKVGNRLRCYGQIKLGQRGLEMTHPECRLITEEKQIPVETSLTPIYPATEGVSQYLLRKLTSEALMQMQSQTLFQEWLPASILETHQFPTFEEAIAFIHRPPQTTALEDLAENKTIAQRRLIFEELLAHRMSLLNVKQIFQAQKSIALSAKDLLTKNLLAQLPFGLTGAQIRVLDDIRKDLSLSQPMLRLVQGDVGSGKTIVAALAMLQAVENGYQALLMAPTELLAEQHYRNFKKWLEPLGVQLTFLSGNVKGVARRDALTAIENGTAQIILGTHALFQEAVNFSRVALLVVDEQHRFGVQQRASLREKAKQADFYPHQLVMTATPIPRTLAMSFYADLNTSIIDELPPGRTPVTTSVIPNTKRDEVIGRIKEACQQGRQVYWVCPLIEESEVINCESATEMAALLQSSLPAFKIGLIHGRMSSQEKEKVMRAFQQNELQLLVATTVIEVGVDVPNASVMVIENAERLGLSQLHQLRGRVGRGAVASFCILLYQAPLSQLAIERLKVMRETTDGFKIAQRDLELRGPGEVLGTQQTGDLSFRVADLLRDSELLSSVQQAADVIMKSHAEIIEPLITRWLKEEKEYGKV